MKKYKRGFNPTLLYGDTIIRGDTSYVVCSTGPHWGLESTERYVAVGDVREIEGALFRASTVCKRGWFSKDVVFWREVRSV